MKIFLSVLSTLLLSKAKTDLALVAPAGATRSGIGPAQTRNDAAVIPFQYFTLETPYMLNRNWSAALLTIALTLALAGCNSNYKYSDANYRPLGEPTTVNRSN
jgi:hypothetical protein